MNPSPRRMPLLCSLYERYLDEQDSAAFISHVARLYTQGTLCRLAVHPFAQVRRAAVLALGFLGDYEANHTMGRALQDDDRTVRMLAENGIRSIWPRAGNDQHRQMLNVIVRLNGAQHYEEAESKATELLEKAGWFAEAWHQRAIARFAMKRYDLVVDDCHQSLEINPYHFVAASTMGQAYLEMQDHATALASFRRALRLNPGLDGVRAQVARLARMIGDK